MEIDPATSVEVASASPSPDGQRLHISHALPMVSPLLDLSPIVVAGSGSVDPG